MGLVNKLVRAAGGWEPLLHETLKDVYDQVVQDTTLFSALPEEIKEIFEEIEDILDAYEERDNKIIAPPKPPKTRKKNQGVDKVSPNNSSPSTERVRPVESGSKQEDKQETQFPERNPEKEEITRVVGVVPQQGNNAAPRPNKARISVDSYAGASSGELPLPGGYKIVNRDRLTIQTTSGIVLGRAREDGQIKGSDQVSGYIQAGGRYRLVFKHTDLGKVLVVYETQKEVKPKQVEMKMITVPGKDGWTSYIREPAIVCKADDLEESKEAVLENLKKEGINIISTTITQTTKDRMSLLRRAEVEGQQ